MNTRTTLFLILIGGLFLNSRAQESDTLSAIERAYLFHTVKKSPILDRHLGRFFTYTGEYIQLSNGDIDYDSIEKNMIDNPTLLSIDTFQISKSPRGIIAEASNKLAIWELNKMLHSRQIKDSSAVLFDPLYQQFETMLLRTLPQKAMQIEEGKAVVHPRIYSVLNPNLSMAEKIAQLNAVQNLSIDDERHIIDAIYRTFHLYIEAQTQRIFQALGGTFSTLNNLLTCAGSGNITDETGGERRKDEKGLWNKGLPKATGFFGFQTEIKPPENLKLKPKIETMPYTTTDWTTVGEHKMTKLHFDVWTYHPDNQVMIVIEKHGKTYPLFNDGSTRFLSPDSTFSGKRTFQKIIDELQNVKIADLTEKIEGKEGLDAQIRYHHQEKDATEIALQKSEKKFSDLGYATITTSNKASKKAKKAKKQAVLRGVGADNWNADPTTKSKKKQKGKSQNNIIDLYQQFEWHKLKIKELEQAKQVAIDLKARYQLQLDQYMQIRGLNWMPYEQKNGRYIFSDSCTFDIYTQDFQFPASRQKESFELRLIAVPDTALAKNAHPVMLHATLLDSRPNEDARINASFLQKMIPSQTYGVNQTLLNPNDSLSVRLFFEALLDKDRKFEIRASGQGIGVWNGVQVLKYSPEVKDDAFHEKFDFDPQQMNENLWWTEIFIHLQNPIVLQINSFINEWDTLPEFPINKKILAIQKKNNLTKEEIFTAYRTAETIKKLQDEFTTLAGRYLSHQDAKKIADRLEKTIQSTKNSVGTVNIALQRF